MGIKTSEVPGEVSVLEGAMNKVCEVGLGQRRFGEFCSSFLCGRHGWKMLGSEGRAGSASVPGHHPWVSLPPTAEAAGHRAQVLSSCGEADGQSPQRRHRSGTVSLRMKCCRLLGLQRPP